MTDSATAAAALTAKLEVRDAVSPEEKAIIGRMFSDFRTIAAGDDIVRDGDRPTHSTLVVDGFSARYKVLQSGDRQLTAIHLPGDFVDLHSFLLKEMDHGVVALSTCRIATVQHTTLQHITQTQPHLTRMFWLLTLIDGAIHREWLVSMGRRPAIGQMAHLICELYLRLQSVGLTQDMSFNFPVTQVELGDLMGLSSVHVNRTLQELRASDLLSWRSQTVTILDWQRLEDLAEFDKRYLHLVKEPR